MKTVDKPKQTTTTKEKIMKTEAPVSNHPLAHLIPSKEKWAGEAYISREIGGIKDLDILKASLDSRHNVLVYGPTGSAKTSLVYAFGAEQNLPVVNVPCNGAAEPRIFIGGWTPTADKSLDYVAGDLLKAVMYGGIVYLDEVNFLPPKIASYIHGMLDRRRTISVPDAEGSSIPTTVKLHPQCFVIGAFNPDYNGTRPLNQAFRNRFAVQLDFPYDNDIEKELLNSTSLIELANHLRLQVDLGHLTTPISTNLLMELEEWNETLSFDFALTNFINHFPSDEAQVVEEVLVNYASKIFDDLNDGDFEKESSFAVKVPKKSEPAPKLTV